MYRIRGFEERTAKLYQQGHIPGFVHLALGQEATAVGACAHLRDGDVITSTHRGHGHALARGLTPYEIYAELMGRETGVCRGRGGSMHIADPDRGIFGANGIVGAGIPIAAGAAFAAQLTETGAIALAFFGDGAVATGAFHEATNLASLWNLPLILFCENNQYSEFSRAEDQHPVTLADRAVGYGLHYRKVNGNNVTAVAEMMAQVVADVRAGNGPYLVEAVTLRLAGHYEGDPQLYRDENQAAAAADPLEMTHRDLLALGLSEHALAEVHASIAVELDTAIADALEAPFPDPAAVADGTIVVREPPPPARLEPNAADAPHDDEGRGSWKLFEAVGEALRVELEDDPTVFLAGIDVGQGGNVFGITRGLHARWPDRLRDTPISETATMGLGVGAAMAGLRPVVELMYVDFLGVCLDQLMNQAAKLPYMTGGRARMPLTVRTQCGAGRSSGAQHSQSLEALLAHIPGLTVLMPSTPADAYGLLRSAIQDPNPVVFIEHRLQYGMKGPRSPRDHLVPIGQAAIRREGSDVTLVSYSRMAQVCLDVADTLASEGISCEVIDLRSIAPLDIGSVLASVAKTSRLLIAHEATCDFGVGAEVAAQMADQGIWHLDAPIVRIGAMPTPAPYSPGLEATWLPDRARILQAARQLVNT